MRVFSKANVLFTFISQAMLSSGSRILTIGTLAVDTQMTSFMPPGECQYFVRESRKGPNSLRDRRSAILQTASSFFQSVVMHTSTAEG